MIQSMTGFGSGRSESPQVVVRADVKTVNHRYLDVHVRLPAEFQSLEAPIRKTVSNRLRRGRVDLTVSIERAHKRVLVEADAELISAYVQLVRSLQREFPISGELTLDAISKVPGAISVSPAEASDEEDRALLAQVEETVGQALSQLVGMRTREGEALDRDLVARIGRNRQSLTAIRDAAALLVEHYRDRLVARLTELAPAVELDSGRLEMEALIYADKSDIAEELTRLQSHMDQFEATLRGSEEAGKRLDFLLQEMNREVTTILSKTSGLARSGTTIGEAAIDMKVEIDKLREQVQNVE
jgi:uncharacterized protein (TIGR00255 family)